MRDLCKVIENIIDIMNNAQIEHTDKEAAEELKNDLHSVFDSAKFAAPEMIRFHWHEGQEYINDFVHFVSHAYEGPIPPWAWEILETWTGKQLHGNT